MEVNVSALAGNLSSIFEKQDLNIPTTAHTREEEVVTGKQI